MSQGECKKHAADPYQCNCSGYDGSGDYVRNFLYGAALGMSQSKLSGCNCGAPEGGPHRLSCQWVTRSYALPKDFFSQYQTKPVSVDLKSATAEALYEELKSRTSVDKLRLLNAWTVDEIADHLSGERNYKVVSFELWENICSQLTPKPDRKTVKFPTGPDYSTWYNPDVD